MFLSYDQRTKMRRKTAKTSQMRQPSLLHPCAFRSAYNGWSYRWTVICICPGATSATAESGEQVHINTETKAYNQFLWYYVMNNNNSLNYLNPLMFCLVPTSLGNRGWTVNTE